MKGLIKEVPYGYYFVRKKPLPPWFHTKLHFSKSYSSLTMGSGKEVRHAAVLVAEPAALANMVVRPVCRDYVGIIAGETSAEPIVLATSANDLDDQGDLVGNSGKPRSYVNLKISV